MENEYTVSSILATKHFHNLEATLLCWKKDGYVSRDPHPSSGRKCVTISGRCKFNLHNVGNCCLL